MPIMIALLRGINLAGHHKIKMDELRALCQSLKLRDVQTYVQSGNVIFRTDEKDPTRLAKKIEDAIEKKFGFHAAVVLRTTAELKAIIDRSPFATRKEIEPAKLHVTFLACDLAKHKCDQILRIKMGLEELKLTKRELYIYYPDGMGKSKLTPLLDRTLEKAGTFRNWNTVTKLLAMAEAMESATRAS
jgi:uncharacterized protein (DUF1697 family)